MCFFDLGFKTIIVLLYAYKKNVIVPELNQMESINVTDYFLFFFDKRY